MARVSKQNNGRTLAPSLAKHGDPLVLPDGRIVHPSGIKVDVEKNQPKPSGQKFKPTKKRSISELPAPVNTLNGVACVLLYSLLGIGDREMADALKISAGELDQIKSHQAYAECFDMLHNEFINVNSENLHARIAAYGHNALSSLAHIALNGQHEGNKLRGSIDLLDRGGVTKKERTLSGGGMEPLRIVHIDGDKRTEVSIGIGESSV